MSEPTPDQNLHLPSLVIKNFRGIDELTIPRLGRVTLLAGKNGVGKTTVLDAIRVWANRGRRLTLTDVLYNSDEVVQVVDEFHGETAEPDWNALFFGRQNIANSPISIGTIQQEHFVLIRMAQISAEVLRPYLRDRPDQILYERNWGLEIKVQGSLAAYLLNSNSMPHEIRYGVDSTSMASEVVCEILGPDLPSNFNIERYWSSVALTDHEIRAVEALNFVTDSLIERVTVVDSAIQRGRRSERRVLAKGKGDERPVPLRSFGDGAVRCFTVALALANSTNGFLLIDEAENGIHHSIQARFWNMVLQTAERNNVQVIATTHSWDCVTGFAQAANELEDVEGLLVRLERVPAGLKAITYDESRLAVVARSDIEVR